MSIAACALYLSFQTQHGSEPEYSRPRTSNDMWFMPQGRFDKERCSAKNEERRHHANDATTFAARLGTATVILVILYHVVTCLYAVIVNSKGRDTQWVSKHGPMGNGKEEVMGPLTALIFPDIYLMQHVLRGGYRGAVLLHEDACIDAGWTKIQPTGLCYSERDQALRYCHSM